MNDPLRDNRIFPEEMHEHAPTPAHHQNKKAVLTIFVVIVLIIAGVYLYRTYQPSPFSPDSVSEPSQEQVAFEALQNSRPPLDTKSREDKINALFGNTQ
ncbi:hypothetical protein KC901_02345 [Patescibacteria group bacterium]|nr:hypothetical protein [Patescibacteria group bacterium]